MSDPVKKLENYIKIKYPKLYILIYNVPWYRIVTVLLIIQIHFLKMDTRELYKENVYLNTVSIILNKKTVELEFINKSLLDKMIMHNRSFEDFPLPLWNKVKRGNKFYSNYYNLVYEKEVFHPFGTNRYQNLGRTNFDNAPYPIASEWAKNDMYIAINGGRKIFLEPQLDKNKKKIYKNNLKWRILKEKDTLIYGMQMP